MNTVFFFRSLRIIALLYQILRKQSSTVAELLSRQQISTFMKESGHCFYIPGQSPVYIWFQYHKAEEKVAMFKFIAKINSIK